MPSPNLSQEEIEAYGTLIAPALTFYRPDFSLDIEPARLPVGQPSYYGLDAICPICLGTFEDPMALLPCRHVLCFRCVQDHMFEKMNKQQRSGFAKCPVCRTEIVGTHRNLHLGPDKVLRVMVAFMDPERPFTFEHWNREQRRIDLRENKYKVKEDMTDREKLSIVNLRRMDSKSIVELIYGPARTRETVVQTTAGRFMVTRDIFLQVEQYGTFTRSELRRRLHLTPVKRPAREATSNDRSAKEYDLIDEEVDGIEELVRNRARPHTVTAGDRGLARIEGGRVLNFRRERHVTLTGDEPSKGPISVQWIIRLHEDRTALATNDGSESDDERRRNLAVTKTGLAEIQRMLEWFNKDRSIDERTLLKRENTNLLEPIRMEQIWKCRYCVALHITGECMLPVSRHEGEREGK